MSDEHPDSGAVATDATVGQGEESPGQSGAPNARVYRILGEQFLARPDRDHVDAVGTWAGEWRREATTLPPAIESALERIERGSEADEETLRTAYTHLFRGVSERAPDPPYESLYADGEFYDETTTEIRRGYRRVGVDVDSRTSNEPPDNLGLELQFLGELVAMTAQETGTAPEDVDLEAATWWLLDDHLTEWLPRYHDRIQQEDPHEYYAGLLELTLAIVTTHHEDLARTQ